MHLLFYLFYWVRDLILLLNIFSPYSLFLHDLLMLLCVLGWVSQGTDSEIEISLKKVYWEYSVFQGQPLGGRGGGREAGLGRGRT